LGKKVLIVDADPQCNLTGLTLGVSNYDDLFKFYDSKQNTDIFNSLVPVFNISSNVAATPLTRTAVTKTYNPNMYILAGNIRLAEMDTQIATALTSSQHIPILRRFVGAINELVRRIADEQNFDIVIFDMSPSISAINHCILMGSDYFIIPISPDFYCYQAIDSLSAVLPRWSEEIKQFRDGNDDYMLPKTLPKMLGFISQNYSIYTVEQDDENIQPKTMAKAYREWIEKIKNAAAQKLVPALKKANMIIDEEVFRRNVRYDVPYHLAGIQKFSGLIPVSQKTSKPIYELVSQDGNWTGARWSHMKNGKEQGIKINIRDANQIYTDLSEAILKMID
jgi:chromosome partitioning protein